MNMKLNYVLALVAALVCYPLVSEAAADAKNADAKAAKTEKAADKKAADKKEPAKKVAEKVVEKAPPSEAEIAKARKNKKKLYTKTAEALDAAYMCNQPLAVFFVLDDPRSQSSQFLEKKLMGDKRFRDDYAKSNLVLLKFKVKPMPVFRTRRRGPVSKDNKIELPKKDADLKMLEKYGLNPQLARRNPAMKCDDVKNYPAVVIINPNGTKLLFRMPNYDSKGGFGAWLSSFDGLMRGARIEPVVSKTVQKILDNPTEPKKWK